MNKNVTRIVFMVLMISLIYPSISYSQESLYKESPLIQEQVLSGELPPIEERLPLNPVIIQPVDEIGVYGGTWHMALNGYTDIGLLHKTIAYENLVRWDEQWLRVIPNIAQSVEINEDATEYTFFLREGMKWSDGVPFTADDVIFWYEDIFSNTELSLSQPTWLTSGGESVVVEKLDDYTLVFRFRESYGLFLQNLASPDGSEPTSYPRHYLEQFHRDYNPDIDDLVQEAGVENWTELFTQIYGRVGIVGSPTRWKNPELPTLYPWLITNPYVEGVETVRAVRNPYYWKVDTAFNQLPYIDAVEYQVVSSSDEVVQLVLDGRIDMQARHISTPANRVLIEAGRENGDYSLYTLVPSHSSEIVISLNMTHQDPELRDIFQNRDFRIGLSYAINRQRIIDLAYGGFGMPYQVAPRPESPFYSERMATQYTEYDVEQANLYLDRAGYIERDDEGFRLRPNGERISISIEYASSFRPPWQQSMLLIEEDWEAVGIEVILMDENLQDFQANTLASNQHDAAIWQGDGGLDVILQSRHYLPNNIQSNHGTAWAYWFLNSDNPLALTPPENVQIKLSLWRELNMTNDPQRQAEVMTEILEMATEDFSVIGITLAEGWFGIVKNDFHNVPRVMPRSWIYPDPAPTNPPQYFIAPGD